MRAIFILLLVVVALAVLTPMVSASAPPHPHHNGSHINFFNDSDCTNHIHTMEVPLPSSTDCVPEHHHHHNESVVFQCTTANNQTDLSFSFYNGTDTCDGTALLSYSSSAPAHTCAPITLTLGGETATLYAHIRCANESESTLSAAANVARQLIAATRKPAAPHSFADLITSKRFHTSKLFA